VAAKKNSASASLFCFLLAQKAVTARKQRDHRVRVRTAHLQRNDRIRRRVRRAEEEAHCDVSRLLTPVQRRRPCDRTCILRYDLQVSRFGDFSRDRFFRLVLKSLVRALLHRRHARPAFDDGLLFTATSQHCARDTPYTCECRSLRLTYISLSLQRLSVQVLVLAWSRPPGARPPGARPPGARPPRARPPRARPPGARFLRLHCLEWSNEGRLYK
jgi:hypothetical protein